MMRMWGGGSDFGGEMGWHLKKSEAALVQRGIGQWC